MNKDIVKKYTFSKEELIKLQDIELGMASFRAALDGMNMTKQIALMQAYRRVGIDGEAPQGITRNISYNIGKNEIVVTDSPSQPEKTEK